MKYALPPLVAGCLTFLLCAPVVALDENFATPLSTEWAVPHVPLAGARATPVVSDAAALDGAVLELVFPGGVTAAASGPAWATQLQTSAARGYGVYEARLRPAAAPGRGAVSAFFTYFNDGLDHDGDGIVDNHEIDYEFSTTGPSAIYMTVWTAYQADANGEVFRKVTRKVNLRTGRMWETPAGGEGTYDLAANGRLGWRVPGFNATRAYRTYRFDWEATQVTFAIDLEDGQGFRTLWTVSGAPNTVIPSQPAPCFVNLFYAAHFNSRRRFRPPLHPAVFDIDRITLP